MNCLPYSREILEADDGGETLVMRWNPGVCCAPHDHGAASGHIHIVTGTFVERRYRFDGVSLRVVETLHHQSPAIVAVDPHTIHDMVSVSGGLTLHRYTPQISAMRVYNHTLRETLVVSDDCGAWVPENSRQVLNRTPWAATR